MLACANRLKRCCATDGRAGSSGSSSQAEYLRSALRERPGLFSRATYFAAHAYPTNCNAPLSDPANLPKEMGGNASWMSSVKATRQLGDTTANNQLCSLGCCAFHTNDAVCAATASWASNASHQASAAAAGTAFRMLVTETGWCGGGDQREKDKARWISDACKPSTRFFSAFAQV